MGGTAIRKLLSLARCLSNVTGAATLLPLHPIGFDEGLVVRHPIRHQRVLDKQMIDEERALVVLRFLVDPEFVLRNVPVPVVLTEVRELLIDVSADIAAIHYPHLNVAASVNLTQVGRFR